MLTSFLQLLQKLLMKCTLRHKYYHAWREQLICRVKPQVFSNKFSKSTINGGINAPHSGIVLLLTLSVNIRQLKDTNTQSYSVMNDRKFSDSFKYIDRYSIDSLIHLTAKLAVILIHAHTESFLHLQFYFSEFSWGFAGYSECGGGGNCISRIRSILPIHYFNIPRSKLLLIIMCLFMA